MKNTWWADLDDLDEDQQQFLDLPASGKHVIFGPPGSGKTNLLLLRAKYLYGKKGFRNILFITYTGCLADFIRSGLSDQKFFEPDQVQTFWSWAKSHIQTYFPDGVDQFTELLKTKKFKTAKEQRAEKERKNNNLVELLKQAFEKCPTHNLYDAIFIDEAQDLSKEQIEELTKLSSVITIAGDNRQSLYEQDGLSAHSFSPITLQYHYRIGPKICELADKILAPKEGMRPLSDYCKYPKSDYESDAEIFSHSSREQQYIAIIDRIRSQLRAYPEEIIGVIVPKKDMIQEFKDYVHKTELREMVAYHATEGLNNSFRSDRLIHVLTIHASKGTEFRAVHIPGGEEIQFPMNRREFMFTAVTRAKTSLSFHHTGKIMPFIESAFAKEKSISKMDLF